MTFQGNFAYERGRGGSALPAQELNEARVTALHTSRRFIRPHGTELTSLLREIEGFQQWTKKT